MLKLICGAMHSGKTERLLIERQQYGSSVLTLPQTWIDNCGRSVQAYGQNTEFVCTSVLQAVSRDLPILVDEGEFLSDEEIQALADSKNDVIVDSLIRDYRGELFPAYEKLYALADEIVELRKPCEECHKQHALYNARVTGGSGLLVAEVDGDNSVQYKCLCKTCLLNK